MIAMLELFYKPTCPYCQKVLRYMSEAGIEGEITLRNVAEDDAAAERLILVGGKWQVPCLFIGGAPLYESDDIVAWLRDNL